MISVVDVLEAMGTARAMRWFRPEPVPDELVETVLWAATRASNPGNSQPWDFVVVRDADQRRRLQEALAPWLEVLRERPAPPDPSSARALAGAKNLYSSFGDVPVVVVVCGRGTFEYPPGTPNPKLVLSGMYAAAQNLVVAARSLGLGAAFTTLHERAEPSFREILAVPDDRVIGVTIPLGWPAGPTGPVSRRPMEDVVHHDRW